MTEGYQLLQNIIEEPEDDGLRLIFADWCDDNGEPERAEFIRAQIENYRLCRLDAPAYSPERHDLLQTIDRLTPRTADWILDTVDRKTFIATVVWTRGFIDEVRCLPSVWCSYGPSVVRLHPIERVLIPHMKPCRIKSGWIWTASDLAQFDQATRLLRGERLNRRGKPSNHGSRWRYETEKDAMDDLSSVLIRWAKQ